MIRTTATARVSSSTRLSAAGVSARAATVRQGASRARPAPSRSTVGGAKVAALGGKGCVVAAAAAEAAELGTQSKLRIKLKAYSAQPLKEAVEAILDVAQATGCDKCGPVYLPTKRRKYTILKSPHVNKDSREQFEIRTHQRLLDLNNVSAQTIDGLMALDLPAGVDVEVKL